MCPDEVTFEQIQSLIRASGQTVVPAKTWIKEAVIDSGATATVYRTRDDKHEAWAYKEPNDKGPPQAVDRFRREVEWAEHVRRLAHPYIIKIKDIGTAPRLYIVMELANLSLKQYLEQSNSTPVPINDAAGVIHALAQGVQAAHERGIIHRDIKPGNILLVGQPVPAPAGADAAASTLPDRAGGHSPALNSRPGPLSAYTPKLA
ncbi:MAG TPA: protein kinase, partial [Gemmataceae bacterium]|nr:protein kinase [Gemmataceae bacterium]